MRLRLLQSMEKMEDSTLRDIAELFVEALGKLPNRAKKCRQHQNKGGRKRRGLTTGGSDSRLEVLRRLPNGEEGVLLPHTRTEKRRSGNIETSSQITTSRSGERDLRRNVRRVEDVSISLTDELVRDESENRSTDRSVDGERSGRVGRSDSLTESEARESDGEGSGVEREEHI